MSRCDGPVGGRKRKRFAGGLRAGPERRVELLGSRAMRMVSVVWCLVREKGRFGRGGKVYSALGSAVAGSMLGHEVAQMAMAMWYADEECISSGNEACRSVR